MDNRRIRRKLAYLARTNLEPDGRFPPFIRVTSDLPRPIFPTGIWLVTGPAFKGNTPSPQSHDPHHWPCGEDEKPSRQPTTSSLYTVDAGRRFILPISNTMAIFAILSMKEEGVRAPALSDDHPTLSTKA